MLKLNICSVLILCTPPSPFCCKSIFSFTELLSFFSNITVVTSGWKALLLSIISNKKSSCSNDSYDDKASRWEMNNGGRDSYGQFSLGEFH
jgi:hypothetical protein